MRKIPQILQLQLMHKTLYKISRGDARAKAKVPVDLAAWCRRESVEGGGRDALNGVWE